MKNEIEAALRLLADADLRVLETQTVGGGCISRVMRVKIAVDVRKELTWMVKTNSVSFEDNFACEYEGLKCMAAVGAIRIPQPILSGVANEAAYLVTQWIESGKRSSRYFEEFGQQLAQFHRQSAGQPIGWSRDNYLGAARQANPRVADWAEFVALHRIGFQIRWAVDQDLADRQLQKKVEMVANRMHQLLAGRKEVTSLLHGDLWSGNYLCDEMGQAVLIDPAVYYGCPEAEFGMLRLFGSCPESFYQAYNQTWPLASGWQRRSKVYVLYHLLNHLNLFGSSYAGQCHSLATEILSDG